MTIEIFMPMPCETPAEFLADTGVKGIARLLGSPEMAEHLGIAIRDGHNGSINIHMMILGKMNGGFCVSEETAKEMIEAWINLNPFEDAVSAEREEERSYGNPEHLYSDEFWYGQRFLTGCAGHMIN